MLLPSPSSHLLPSPTSHLLPSPTFHLLLSSTSRLLSSPTSHLLLPLGPLQMPLVTEELDRLVQNMTEEAADQRVSLRDVLNTCKPRTSNLDVEGEVRRLVIYILGDDDSVSVLQVCVCMWVCGCVGMSAQQLCHH